VPPEKLGQAKVVIVINVPVVNPDWVTGFKFVFHLIHPNICVVCFKYTALTAACRPLASLLRESDLK
jgi:hypothetical protein